MITGSPHQSSPRMLTAGNPERHLVAVSTADALDRTTPAPSSRPIRALVGFDGFLDTIIQVVDTRRDMSPEGYTPIATITDFAARVARAAGKSANLELVCKDTRFGGNGPLLASALAGLGASVDYIGAVGCEDAPSRLHPAYEPFAARCRSVTPMAPPAFTDALEFQDGKVMLGKPANVQRVTWTSICDAVGESTLAALTADASLIGIVNWTLCGGVQGIWEGLIDLWSRLASATPYARRSRVFIDLSDPAKRSDADLRSALEVLSRMNRVRPVTLGLNLAEAQRLAKVTGVDDQPGPEPSASNARTIAQLAADLLEATALSTVAIHPRHGAAAAKRRTTGIHDNKSEIEVCWIDGPFVREPALSTGAGDHFNGGMAYGQALGLDLAQCLALGVATSGAYVRLARSADRHEIATLLRGLPGPEPH